MPRKAGRIDVRAAVNEGLVEVSVADSGVGIAPVGTIARNPAVSRRIPAFAVSGSSAP